MNLDDLLRTSLTDDRWALPVPADTLDRVRRSRARRRRARVTAAVVSTGALVAVGALLVGGGSAPSRSVLQPAAAAPSVGCAAPPAGALPGSDPTYVIRSARDWFMTKAQSDAFFRTYNQPSPEPRDRVPSPQPSGPLTDRLVAAVVAAGVPGAENLGRDEAEGGARGSFSLQGALPDGRHLFVSRNQSLFPFTTSGYYGSDTADSSKDVVIEQVPGTACVALLLESRDATNAPFTLVQVMTPDGVSTTWGGGSYPLAELKGWAYAAARWETEHPSS